MSDTGITINGKPVTYIHGRFRVGEHAADTVQRLRDQINAEQAKIDAAKERQRKLNGGSQPCTIYDPNDKVLVDATFRGIAQNTRHPEALVTINGKKDRVPLRYVLNPLSEDERGDLEVLTTAATAARKEVSERWALGIKLPKQWSHRLVEESFPHVTIAFGPDVNNSRDGEVVRTETITFDAATERWVWGEMADERLGALTSDMARLLHPQYGVRIMSPNGKVTEYDGSHVWGEVLADTFDVDGYVAALGRSNDASDEVATWLRARAFVAEEE